MSFAQAHIAELVALWQRTATPVYAAISDRNYDFLVPSRIAIQKNTARVFTHTVIDMTTLSPSCAAAIRAMRDVVTTRETVDMFAAYIDTHPDIPLAVLAADDTGSTVLAHDVHCAFYAIWNAHHMSTHALYTTLRQLARIPYIHIQHNSQVQLHMNVLVARYKVITYPTLFMVEPSRIITQLITHTENAPDTYSIITSRDAFFIVIVIAAVHGFEWLDQLFIPPLPSILQPT